MRFYLILAFIGVFAFSGCSKNKEGANYQHVDEDDAALKAAVAKAVSTTNEFMPAYRAQKPGTSGFYLKKPYQTPSGSLEHMWIEISGEGDGIFKGRISNEAEETREVKIGQQVFVRLNEISDWQYREGNKLIGGYTIRYFVDKMSPAERKDFFKQSGFEF